MPETEHRDAYVKKIESIRDATENQYAERGAANNKRDLGPAKKLKHPSSPLVRPFHQGDIPPNIYDKDERPVDSHARVQGGPAVIGT